MTDVCVTRKKMNKIKAWLQLLSTPEIGNAKAIKLAKKLGEPEGFIGSQKLNDIEIISENAKNYLSKNEEPEDWNKISELIEEFEKVEREKIGIGRHEELHKILHHLKEIYLEA